MLSEEIGLDENPPSPSHEVEEDEPIEQFGDGDEEQFNSN